MDRVKRFASGVRRSEGARFAPALGVIAPCLLLSIGSVALLSASDSLTLGLFGALLLALNLVQWFVVMHECGHGTLFPWKPVNTALGHLAGALTLFPFHAWRVVHHQHHVWTGWKDKDPTTARAVPRNLPAWQRRVIDSCWRWHVPLFMFIYRFDNFWSVGRLSALLGCHRFARAVAWNAALLGAVYLSLALLLPGRVSLLLALAFFLFNVLIEPLMLSQHTHIAQGVSSPELPAQPHAPRDQVAFTRSAYFPPLVSRLLVFHFDRHEAHHAHPAAPCYELPHLEIHDANGMPFFRWWRESRRLPGHVLLFKTREETGAPL